jgi:solute carrier family 36 (proton-coupled amino acid transporter)
MAADAKAPLLESRSGATPAQTLGNIVVSIVGTGVLGLPYAFRTAGWLRWASRPQAPPRSTACSCS